MQILAMRPFRPPLPVPPAANGSAAPDWAALAGPVSYQGDPQALFATESLAQACGNWKSTVVTACPCATHAETAQAQVTADWEHADPQSLLGHPPTPLPGYRLIEITVTSDSPGTGQKLKDVTWPRASIPLSVLRGRRLRPPHPDLVLTLGDRVNLLTAAPDRSPTRAAANENHDQPATDGSGRHALHTAGIRARVAVGCWRPGPRGRRCRRSAPIAVAGGLPGNPGDARTLLFGITGTMITIIALPLGLAVVALQLSSTQFSPRLRNFLRDPPNQIVLSAIVATFAYCAAGLYAVGVSGGNKAPHVAWNQGRSVHFLGRWRHEALRDGHGRCDRCLSRAIFIHAGQEVS